MLKLGAILPHPPIMVKEIGGEEIKKVESTISAMKKIAADFEKEKIETVVIISPHAPMIPKTFTMLKAEKYEGDFSNFGFAKKSWEFSGNAALALKIQEKTREKNIPLLALQANKLDHGILVPLYFLSASAKASADKSKKSDFKIVPFSYSFLSREIHLNFGEVLKEAAQEQKENIALVASGDLSHSLTEDAPAPFNPAGKEFDEKIKELLEAQKFDEIIDLDEGLVENAAECGYRSILILLGAIKSSDFKAKVLSYEGPFGVGYLVAEFTP